MFKKNSMHLLALLVIVSFTSSSFLNPALAGDAPKIERKFVFDSVQTDLKDQADAAGYIFHGVVTNVETKTENDVEFNEVTFKVNKWIKGNTGSNTFVAKIWTATNTAFTFEEGEEDIVAFYPESDKGLTTPIGVGDGKYRVSSEGFIFRKKVAINKLRNIGITKNLKTGERIPLTDKNLLKRLEDSASEGNPVSCNDLISAFEDLVNN